jgi:hypothetical protein
MATGDQSDFVGRLLRLLPFGWFPAVANNLQSLLAGIANAFSSIYGSMKFTLAQMRVNTASGAWLDLASNDYFGGMLPRLQYEPDTLFRARILYNMTAPRGTFAGMNGMLTQLTGYVPVIVQPNNPVVCGGLATPANPAAGGGSLACYDSGAGGAGYIGSLTMPGQVFITVERPTTGWGIYGGLNGLATPATPAIGGGYGLATPGNASAGGGFLCLADEASLPGYITDSFIYEQVNNWMPAGFVGWTRIT